MLSKEIFKESITELIACFPNWKFKSDDPNYMRILYGKFKHLDDVTFQVMVNSYIKNESYNPTVKGLLSHKKEFNKKSDSIDT